MKPKNLLNIWGVYILLLLIFSISVLAQNTNYTNAGSHNFANSFGYFNQELTDDNQDGQPLTSPKGMALVDDLDGDGNNEIVVQDGSNLNIYEWNAGTQDLESVDGCSITPTTDKIYSNLILDDIDNDNFTEMIIAMDTGNNFTIEILEFNGTACFTDSTLSAGTSADYLDGDIMIGCGDDECIVVYSWSQSSHSSAEINVRAFNSTTIGTATKIDDSLGSNFLGYCTPRIPYIDYGQLDNDETYEYTFTYMEFNDANNPSDYVFIRAVYVNDSFDVIDDDFVSLGVNPVQGNGVTCTAGNCECDTHNIGSLFSSPLVHDLDGSPSNGEEVVIASMISEDEFLMYSYESSLTYKDEYPEQTPALLGQADGILVSNVALADVFGDTDREDFCVVGYNTDKNLTDILCGSMKTISTPESREFTAPNLYNVSDTSYASVIHSGRHLVEDLCFTDCSDADEIITSYGVYQLKNENGLLTGGCSLFGDCLATLIYEVDVSGITAEGGAITPVDNEKIDRDDLIVVTSTNIWYVDDGYTDLSPQFDEICFNPSLASTWEINTTFQIDITATDSEGADYRTQVTLYKDTANEQVSDWSSWFGSGTTIPISESSNLQINQTIGSGVVEIIVQDRTNNNTLNTSVEYPFSVSTDGVVKGDISNCYTFEDEDEDETDLTTDVEGDTYENNTITSGLTNLTDTLGWNIGIKAVWLMVMVLGFMAIVVGSFFKGGMGTMSLMITAGLVVFFELMMVILGFFFGIFGWGVLITLFMFATAIVGLLVLRPFITGGD